MRSPISALRVARMIGLLLMATLPGCFTELLWSEAPHVKADTILATGVDESHVLFFELGFTNGEQQLFKYPLAGRPEPREAIATDEGAVAMHSEASIVVPSGDSTHQPVEDRFAPGSTLYLWLDSNHTLRVAHRRDAEQNEWIRLPQQGLDWHSPDLYARIVWTPVFVLLDVVTSPIQVPLYLYYYFSSDTTPVESSQDGTGEGLVRQN